MRMPVCDDIVATLDAAVSAGASSEDVATLVAAAVRGIDQALTPVLGSRGVAALYKRSLHLSRPKQPWLPAPAEGDESSLELASLTVVLATRTSAEAASAGAVVIDRFCALLASLIGESLTERLLRPIRATYSSGPSAQDTLS